MNPFRVATGAMLVALLIVACSSCSSPSEEPTSTPTPTTIASEVGSLPSFAPGAGDLEGMLPDEVGGITLTYQHLDGATADSGEVTPEVQDFLDRTGTRLEDVTSAIGVGFDQAAGGYISIFAIQVSGADEGTLGNEFRMVLAEDPDTVLTETTLGGKDVLAFGAGGQDADGFMYVHEDVVFLVRGSTPELTGGMLMLLP
jgi:hypothetical protein